MTCKCNGTGKVVDTIPEGPWVDKGEYQIRNAGGYSSRLCSCRKNLERRAGVAGHSMIAEDVRRLAYSLLSAAQIAEDTDREAMAIRMQTSGSGSRPE